MWRMIPGTRRIGMYDSCARRALLKNAGAACALVMFLFSLGHAGFTMRNPWQADGTTGAVIGWDSDKHAALVDIDGSIIRRDGGQQHEKFSIWNSPAKVKWYNQSGYLPCYVLEFERENCTVRITHFGDKVTIAGSDYVIAYSRVSINNHGTVPSTLTPGASSGFIVLTAPTGPVAPGATLDWDYALPIDRFGASYPLPSTGDVQAAGSWDTHFVRMRDYWDGQLAKVSLVNTPDTTLNNAFRAIFITDLIVKDGDAFCTGEYGYDVGHNHDAMHMIAALITMGYYDVAKRAIIEWWKGGVQYPYQYMDAPWQFNWLFALYFQKTGDTAFIRQYWPNSSSPSIYKLAHDIPGERTGPRRIMASTPDQDATNNWTWDNYAALMGLISYRNLADVVGNAQESLWALTEHNSLLDSLNAVLSSTISNNALSYIPAAAPYPNTQNKSGSLVTNGNHNWSMMFAFGAWPFDGYLFGAPQRGPCVDLIDSTYAFAERNLAKFGMPIEATGTADNAAGEGSGFTMGGGASALRGSKYRTLPIGNLQHAIKYLQAGPFTWWQDGNGKSASLPWAGVHPSYGMGSLPGMWTPMVNERTIVQSFIAEFWNGDVLIGRGIPDNWLVQGAGATNVPIGYHRRISVTIRAISASQIRLDITGDQPRGSILFNLPLFLHNQIVAVSTGTFDATSGTATAPASVRSLTVTLRNGLPGVGTRLRSPDAGSAIRSASLERRNGSLVANVSGVAGPGNISLHDLRGRIIARRQLTPGSTRQSLPMGHGGTAGGCFLLGVGQGSGGASARAATIMVR